MILPNVPSCHTLSKALTKRLSPHTGTCNNVAAADIVFLVDGSSSIGRANFGLVRSFMAGLIRPYTQAVGASGIRVGAVQYSDTARFVSP